MWGDFPSEKEELYARRDFMPRRGYRMCNIPACNCNSWHGGKAGDRLSEMYDLLRERNVRIRGTLIETLEQFLPSEED